MPSVYSEFELRLISLLEFGKIPISCLDMGCRQERVNANDGIEFREGITGDLREPGRPWLSDSSCVFAPPEVALVNKLAFENLRQRPVRIPPGRAPGSHGDGMVRAPAGGHSLAAAAPRHVRA